MLMPVSPNIWHIRISALVQQPSLKEVDYWRDLVYYVKRSRADLAT